MAAVMTLAGNRFGLTAPTVQPHRDARRIGPGHSVACPGTIRYYPDRAMRRIRKDRSSCPASGPASHANMPRCPSALPAGIAGVWSRQAVGSASSKQACPLPPFAPGGSIGSSRTSIDRLPPLGFFLSHAGPATSAMPKHRFRPSGSDS